MENQVYTENKIKIKNKIQSELSKVTNTDLKDRVPLKTNKKWQKQPNADKVGKLCSRRFSTRLQTKSYTFK